MSQTSSTFAQATPDVSQKTDPACESIFSNLSPNASRLLVVLLNIKRNWFNKQIMLGMGITLGHHGVLENGSDGLLSAVDELKEKGAIEDLTGCENGGIRVRDGIKLEGPYACWGADDMFRVGCVMLYTAVSLIFGARDEKLEDLRAKCVEAAKEIVNVVNPDGREVIWNTLSAGLCALSGAHELLGYEDEAKRLRTCSYKYDMTPEGRKRWEELMNAAGLFIRISFFIDFLKGE